MVILAFFNITICPNIQLENVLYVCIDNLLLLNENLPVAYKVGQKLELGNVSYGKQGCVFKSKFVFSLVNVLVLSLCDEL